jgi:quinol monooxygenase YgiN
VAKSEGPTVVVVTLTPRPDHYPDVVDLLCEVIPQIQEDPGCLLYALHEACDKTVVLIESWRDREAWLAHFSLPPILRLKQELTPWLAAPAKRVEMYQV